MGGGKKGESGGPNHSTFKSPGVRVEGKGLAFGHWVFLHPSMAFFISGCRCCWHGIAFGPRPSSAAAASNTFFFSGFLLLLFFMMTSGSAQHSCLGNRGGAFEMDDERPKRCIPF